jgi:uncharacterized phage protein gp47/JayE
MSLATPTTADINANIIAQLEASLNQTIPLLPKSFLRVLAKVLAGVFILLYKYGGFIHLQQFVSTATYDETEINGRTVRPLQEWGRLFGVTDLVEATQAEMTIDMVVTNQVGQLDAGTQLIGTSNGVTYITIGVVLLDAPTVVATVRAVADQSGGDGSGTIGNLDPGQTMSFANALANVNRETTVNTQTITGADAETVESYRARIISAVSARPQGGAYADYRIWGLEVAGIANIYPYTGDPAGEVDVYVESATETDGIPTQAQLDAVFDHIELVRPAGALVNSLAITRNTWKSTVTGLNAPDLPATQSAVDDAIEAYYLAREPFIVGLDVLPRKDVISRSAVIGTVEDVVTALGGTFTTVVIEDDNNPGVPVELQTLAEGEKVKSSIVVYN